MAMPVTAHAETQSAYACANLETANDIQLLEGKDGMFFRVIPDVKMFHPFTDAAIDYVAELSAALKAKGTTLIYVPVPTKSVVLPDLMPQQAALYGFNPVVANSIYEDVIKRLEAKGVIAVDIASQMRKEPSNPNGDLAFFRTDFHWTAQGAGPAAKQIAKRLIALPGYEGTPQLDAEPAQLPPETIPSTMRRIVQRFCQLPIPEVSAHPYQFNTAGTDIFGNAPAAPESTDIFADAANQTIALVGTSFSDLAISNFADFIAQYTGLPVDNYSISGGNQFGSILSYITSREFQAVRPKFMVWENPIYNNLAQFGDAPFKELLAAVVDECSPALPLKNVNNRTVAIDLSGRQLNADETILADIGANRGRRATFKFVYGNGDTRQREVERGDRLRSTGRYFLPLDGVANEPFTKLEISFDADINGSEAVKFCQERPGDK